MRNKDIRRREPEPKQEKEKQAYIIHSRGNKIKAYINIQTQNLV